ncbi:hypothetical protein [Metapseudomonas otitidis]|uniref:hypothetical protein n=1 Tax=Metapseudomonas otitidis TaxID=319939 RepID=UPI001AAFCA8A|nr:hypothetical protein [Pseudomonas otitidis]MBO2926656.1 hypothetical protein [Pseudomonas otitidis]
MADINDDPTQPNMMLDQKPVTDASPIKASETKYPEFNKVWVLGGDCYLLDDRQYELFLKKQSHDVFINGNPVTQHQARSV